MAEGWDDLARHLRQSAGQELRAEAAEDEELMQLQRLRRWTLAEAARAAMHRGDRITVWVAGQALTHPVVVVGDDYLTMKTDERWADVHLRETVMTVSSNPAGGRSGRPAAATFRARMGEHEQERVPVEVMTIPEDRWSGRLEVLASDHLALEGPDGQRSYIPLESVAVVFSRFPPRRS